MNAMFEEGANLMSLGGERSLLERAIDVTPFVDPVFISQDPYLPDPYFPNPYHILP